MEFHPTLENGNAVTQGPLEIASNSEGNAMTLAEMQLAIDYDIK
jgi:hypothetical protein